jgi:pimeloyl-ACP methyl ester carboxylesterase
VFLHAAPNAKATLILLPGGAGGIGRVGDAGWPDGGNFLVRSAPMFAAAGYNLAIMARPTDMEDMDYGFRTSRAHVDDLRRVAQMAKQKFGAPVWLVGTSRGTVSAAVASIEMRDEALIDGIVLTSSVTNLRKRAGAVPTLSLDRIRVPVLVVHHEKDACENCRPDEAGLIVRGLTNAPVKKLVMVNGGSGARGNPCEPFHYHGYIGMEQEAVNIVAGWIRNPAP